MIQRCQNPKIKNYKDYGGRGITVCDRWLDFKNFYADMGDRPEGLELDRINNNKGYYKENCRWTTHTENSRNQRTSKYWCLFGIKYSAAIDAALVLGVGSSTIERWCDGYSDKWGYHKPKKDCYSELKYSRELLCL